MRISCFQGIDFKVKGDKRIKGKSQGLLALNHSPLSLFYALQGSGTRALMTGNAPPHNS